MLPTGAAVAATLLLALPWELLHDGMDYILQGVRGVRVRRQLPSRTPGKAYTIYPPLRVLLVSPRPEKDDIPYIDYRSSTKPLIEALAPLGSLAEWTFLTPPTFEAFKVYGGQLHAVDFFHEIAEYGALAATRGLRALGGFRLEIGKAMPGIDRARVAFPVDLH